MKKLTRLLAPLLAACAMTGPVGASPVLSMRATPAKVHPPGNIYLDIVISGLQSGDVANLLGAFDLTLTYDPAVLQLLLAGQSTFGSALGDTADPTQTIVGGDVSAPGAFRFFEVSLLEASGANCVFCSGPYLEDLQSDGFTLATLAFYAPAALDGVYSTTFGLLQEAAVFSDAFGNAIADVAVQDRLSVAIPEPGVLLLVATAGFAAAVGGGRRRRQAPPPAASHSIVR